VIYVPRAKLGNHVKTKIMHVDGKTAKAEIIK
jgi:predicted RNA-binding protein with TRAM domain